MQLVVVMAVMNAVSAATIIFTAISITLVFFIAQSFFLSRIREFENFFFELLRIRELLCRLVAHPWSEWPFSPSF